MTEDGDEHLVRRTLDGERNAFGALVHRYQKPVYNAALRLLRDPDAARDVAQTAFLKAFEHLADYDPHYRFYSWLYRIAVNEALHQLERRKPESDLTGEEIDPDPGPERRAEGDDARRELEAALMVLNPELRSVVVLRHVLHLSYEDIGTALAIPEKTVKSRLYSARQQLRTRLTERRVL